VPGEQEKGQQGEEKVVIMEDCPCNLLTMGKVSHNLSGRNCRYISWARAASFHAHSFKEES